ncbi:class I SAM-dependent methyltransferase [Planomonospora venezuelensis]|uniref:SAM-dependent methyltransferase n=1 Tax=Planomonospora venezuelensis TaxID=1999 RepID=A0A841DA97_PLAVE|nr:class I SAM-dependent methyltransferase [Planomonospora venezuelensis]MBB5965394.1 SAM-dependent methyltransferase [Planomonospora venezuelensis]GIN05164.1 SAM-dependent methyltransferase [Planomonospora venezuelensis]
MNAAKVEEFYLQIAQEALGATLSLSNHLGDLLGIYRAMAGAGPLTSTDLATRTGLSERYLREWLSTQAVAGHLSYDPATGAFELPDEHAAVLADDDAVTSRAGQIEAAAAAWLAVDGIAAAFRSGEGFGWHRHDPRLFTGVSRFFAPLYRMSLVQQWLPALDGVVERLRSGAHVLDVGCGHGTSTLLMAEAFPASRFEGIDYHEASVEAARQAAAKAGVDGRVHFHVGDATEDAAGPWDLICFFDALHDMGDPVAAARRAREALAEDGTLLVVEPAAADRLEDRIGNPVSMSYYAASTVMCVPHSLSEEPGLALGAQAGSERLREVLVQAGFSRVRLALTTEYNLVIEARP